MMKGNVVCTNPRAAAWSAARVKPRARVTNSEMGKSSAIMCWFGLVWFGLVWFGRSTFLADVIEFRGVLR